MEDSITRSIFIPTDIERVWDALTTAAGMRHWFGDEATIELRPGGRATFGWSELGETIDAVVEVVDPPHRFSYRWVSIGAASIDDGPSTRVAFTLSEDDTGTIVTVVESGFASLPDGVRTRAYEENTSGWASEFEDLHRYLVSAA